MSQRAPVNIVSLGGSQVACATAVFRHRGALRVTAIVKSTFMLVPGGVATPAAPMDIIRQDYHVDGHPGGSLLAASDLAPHRPRVDVTFVGHAHAPQGATSAVAARLAIFRERPILDKTIHVYGDRDDDPSAEPRPFERMPIVYERACASPHGPSAVDNPVGVAHPNLVDPRDPRKPAGFGPISSDWPARTRLLGAADRCALDAPIVEIPDAFDWRYFQAAPPDQQMDALHGWEWLVLDGLHPTLPRLQTRLPSTVVVARIQHVTGSDVGQEDFVTLVPDTLALDGDRQLCHVVWRGSFPVPGGEAALPLLRIVARLDLASGALGTLQPKRSRVPTGTLMDVRSPTSVDALPDGAGVAAAGAPFPLPLPGAARPSSSEVAGAPWATSASPRAPVIDVRMAGTLVIDVPAELRTPAASERHIGPGFPPSAKVQARTLMEMPVQVSIGAPFPLADPAGARLPSPEIAGAPWAAASAPVVPRLTDALARTSLLVEVPAALRMPSRPANLASRPALPLKGTLYGNPKANR